MNRTQFEEYSEQRREDRAGAFIVERQAADRFTVNGHGYQLLIDQKQGFDPDAFADRFSTILSKYDYIVGDWGFDQLRLKGFYAPSNPLYRPERGFETIQDYLLEDCNFGCAYFVVQNDEVQIPRALTKGKKSKRSRNSERRSANRGGQRSHRSRRRRTSNRANTKGRMR